MWVIYLFLGMHFIFSYNYLNQLWLYFTFASLLLCHIEWWEEWDIFLPGEISTSFSFFIEGLVKAEWTLEKCGSKYKAEIKIGATLHVKPKPNSEGSEQDHLSSHSSLDWGVQ